ncbi:MAG: protein-export rane protein SecD [Clostridia bacterium]|jgi:protein-export membrane protein SecD|uniref:protein translocase subunit SecD n=1 Tax=Petroclostridium xylanilyticum TaxID=1792311 RepID=UPI000B98E47F|nr:protein translocase subunit SecD [Petroclostridium xylanilyticum]MBZ4644830.1 protein-export rane protein SecD [Clostridia bacterium]
MMAKSLTKFIITALIIAALTYVAFYGITLFGKTIPSALDPENGIRRGLDLTGGSVITYEAEAQTVTDEEMNTAIDMLRQRLDTLGYFEATITRQGEKRIRIEIPAISNPEEAVQKLGATAELQFVDPDGKVIITGKDVVDAKAQYGQYDPAKPAGNFVSLTISEEGTKKFADATARVSKNENKDAGKNYIAIKLDQEIISQPFVDQEITTKDVVISGSFTAESAGWLANLIRAGKLPFSLKDVELRSVGPTLGEKALETSLMAGGIGVILVLIFMLIYYRIPGLVADIALIAYIAIVAIIMAGFRVNLSLPGIAGIILSIGMAVDANVVIFERIKEELRAGKTLRAAIDAGFSRAFTAIIDANITTLIAAAVLWKFGTGPIKGFAVTLSIGILTSMFSAIVITRFLLRQTVGMNIKNPKLYGA